MATQQFTHALDVLKGWPNTHALDKKAKWASSVTLAYALSGRVASLNTSNEFVLGCSLQKMPIFIIQSGLDPDVSNEDADGDWYAIQPAGDASGLVGNGPFELESTEYDTNDTFAIGDLLTVINTAGANQGKLDKLSSNLYASNIFAVGHVTKGIHTNHHGKSVISFWTLYIPAPNAS
jgi:hypothetical protein